MKKILQNRRGEGYIDICIGAVVFIMFIVTLINIIGLIIEHENMEAACDSLLDTATSTGEFGTAFYDTADYYMKKYGYFDIYPDADRFLNDIDRVQLGERMTVTVSKTVFLKGLGIIEIPLDIRTEKTGLSERYWK